MFRNRSTSSFGDTLLFNEAPDFVDAFDPAPVMHRIADVSATEPAATEGGAADVLTGPVTTGPRAPAPILVSDAGGVSPSGNTAGPRAIPSTGTSDGIHTHGGIMLDGTDGADVLVGTRFADEIHGRGGDDLIQGGRSSDRLFGDEGNDTLEGGYGNDILDGGAGNDTLRGGEGADTLIGGDGIDNVSYVLSNAGVIVDLATGGVTNDAAGDTYSGIENVFGTSYGDIINGDGQANILHGNSGDDFLFGQGGDDRIFGDLGFDVLRGGAGNDILNGGRDQDRLTGDDDGQFGYDTFVIQNGNGVDIITDFQHGYDRIDLRGYGITGFGWDGRLAVGPVSGESWFLGGLDGGDRLVFDPDTDTLYEVTVAWSDADDAFYVSSRHEIVTVQSHNTLSADDLVLN